MPVVQGDELGHPEVSPQDWEEGSMSSRAVVENATSLWNNHDREGYIACFAEDCEYNVPRRPGKGRAAVAAFWDFNAAAFSDGHTRIEVLVESGETVVMEAVFEATHTGPLATV